jgi:hypothetical protein
MADTGVTTTFPDGTTTDEFKRDEKSNALIARDKSRLMKARADRKLHARLDLMETRIKQLEALVNAVIAGQYAAPQTVYVPFCQPAEGPEPTYRPFEVTCEPAQTVCGEPFDYRNAHTVKYNANEQRTYTDKP